MEHVDTEAVAASRIWDALSAGLRHDAPRWLELAVELRDSNERQWQEEDRSRHELANDELAAIKRRIDTLNGGRVEAIHAIDLALLPQFEIDTSAPPLVETLGQTIDRMTIAWIREERSRSIAWPSGGAAPPLLAEVRHAGDALRRAFDANVEDLVTGRRSVVPTRTVKLYRPAGTAPGEET